jgi:hypothetical protein
LDLFFDADISTTIAFTAKLATNPSKGEVKTRSLEVIVVKGISTPVQTYEVLYNAGEQKVR